MKISKKLSILMFILIAMVFSQNHELIHVVYIWPDGYDAGGTKWWTYNLYKAETHWNNETSVACYTEDFTAMYDCIVWHSEIGNFNGGVNPWINGDTIVTLGSWDSVYARDPSGYGDNPDHTGFYWLYSDTLNATVHPEYWTPYDTLSVIPKIDVTKTGPGGGANDTIWFEFPNPKETRRIDQTDYDVYGFWLFADTTGTGTPNAFNAGTVMDLGIIPVDGVYVDTTLHWMLESDGFEAWTSWTVYFAYKIIARPDTTADNIGYSTYYFSQNSDPTTVYQNVIAVEENQSTGFEIKGMDVIPNPSRGNFNIKFNTTGTGYATLRLYDVLGRDKGILWQGDVKSGSNIIELHDRSKGVYFLVLESNELKAKKKIVID